MKTKFPAMMAGTAFGALFILGAAIGPAAAWDHRDDGPRYGGRGDSHYDMTVIVMGITGAGAAGTIDTGDLTARAGMGRHAIVVRKSSSTFRRRSSTIPHIPMSCRHRSCG